jgi:predicted nucleic acid-binding protein
LAEELQQFFAACHVLPVTDAVVARAIELRQGRKMALGDALIAATALEMGRELLTHNSKDYEGIAGLVVIDPIAGGDPGSESVSIG